MSTRNFTPSEVEAQAEDLHVGTDFVFILNVGPTALLCYETPESIMLLMSQLL